MAAKNADIPIENKHKKILLFFGPLFITRFLLTLFMVLILAQKTNNTKDNILY